MEQVKVFFIPLTQFANESLKQISLPSLHRISWQRETQDRRQEFMYRTEGIY